MPTENTTVVRGQNTVTVIEDMAPESATSQTVEVQRKVFPFLLGADPEFLVFHGTHALDAAGLLRSALHDKNLEAKQMGFVVEGCGEIGWDGASSTGEFRIQPTNDPSEFVERFRGLLTEMHKHLPLLDFTTLSIGSPIGGHIHVDAPDNLCEDYTSSTKKAEKDRIKKLVATLLVPLIANDHKISASARYNTGNYGRIDDVRWHKAGTDVTKSTAEIRGLSAEWITTPETMMATLSYIGVIWHEILKNNSKLIKNPVSLKTNGHVIAIQGMVIANYDVVENSIITSITKMVKKFELYPLFKKECDFILDRSRNQEAKSAAGWTLSAGWGFSQQHRMPTKAKLLSSKSLAVQLKNPNQAEITQNFTLAHNNDFNIDSFVSAIAIRRAILGWALKNEYFLFGLKNGVEGYAAMDMTSNKFYSMPSNQEKTITVTSCDNMATRFMHSSSSPKIDPKTGAVRHGKSNKVVIGIPYSIRAANDTKSLINIIWQIENGKLPLKKASEFTVTSSGSSSSILTTNETVSSCVMGKNGSADSTTLSNLDDDDIAALLEDNNED